MPIMKSREKSLKIDTPQSGASQSEMSEPKQKQKKSVATPRIASRPAKGSAEAMAWGLKMKQIREQKKLPSKKN